MVCKCDDWVFTFMCEMCLPQTLFHHWHIKHLTWKKSGGKSEAGGLGGRRSSTESLGTPDMLSFLHCYPSVCGPSPIWILQLKIWCLEFTLQKGKRRDAQSLPSKYTFWKLYLWLQPASIICNSVICQTFHQRAWKMNNNHSGVVFA